MKALRALTLPPSPTAPATSASSASLALRCRKPMRLPVGPARIDQPLQASDDSCGLQSAFNDSAQRSE